MSINDHEWREIRLGELIGIDLDDCMISIQGDVLHVKGLNDNAEVTLDGTPVKQGHTQLKLGNFYEVPTVSARKSDMSNWKNFPKSVSGAIDVSFNQGLNTLAGCPPCTDIRASNTGIRDLMGVPEPLGDEFEDFIVDECRWLQDLKGIESIKSVWFSFTAWPHMPILRAVTAINIENFFVSLPGDLQARDPAHVQITRILNTSKHLALSSKNKAIMSAQRALVDMGRGDLAKW